MYTIVSKTQGSEIICTIILPKLIPLLCDNNISGDRFLLLMNHIRGMLDQVEKIRSPSVEERRKFESAIRTKIGLFVRSFFSQCKLLFFMPL